MSKAQQIIGMCVRAFREQQALSLEALAVKAGISYQYLSGVETGKENFSIQVLESLSKALAIPVRALVVAAYDTAAGAKAPRLNQNHFRRQVPLPAGLNVSQIEAAVNLTQSIIHRININMTIEVGKTLQSLIQGNNFSGLVSNILTNSLNDCSEYKHNNDQKYPDLVFKDNISGDEVGLEIKTTINIGKGGESHNGHSGWHFIACYNFIENGDIQFVHLMLANLIGHQNINSDWSYVGSKVNSVTGSRRTETYSTNILGATKLRDGSVFLEHEKVNFSRWRQKREGSVPKWSIFADNEKVTETGRL
jgi:transcriptional regulator with XRE-family HTH domain